MGYKLEDVVRLKSKESFYQTEGITQDEIDTFEMIMNECTITLFQIFDIIPKEHDIDDYVIVTDDNEMYIITDNMIEEKVKHE